MKRITILLTISALATAQLFAQNPLKSYKDSVSYAIGLDISNNLIQSKLDSELSPENLAQGIIDGMNKNNYKIHPDQAQIITQAYFMKVQEAKKAEENQKYQANIEIGKKFLEENKKQPGVKVTPSGLQYKVNVQGKGPKPQATDQVTLHYEGKLINGTIFDSSIKRGEPATFGVTQVIPGFSEAIQMMPVGSKYTVYIPQELAYGERQAGQIEPYSTLIFDIEIIAIPSQTGAPDTAAPAPAKDEKASKKKDK
jgi:FKBP-type peptidyl-prolyl cis-trans isomerase FklB